MTEPVPPVPPHSGNDTWDLIENALRELASLIDQAERMIPMFATEAHANGATWTDIATALGTSPEQAELRYNPDSPVADNRWPYDHD